MVVFRHSGRKGSAVMEAVTVTPQKTQLIKRSVLQLENKMRRAAKLLQSMAAKEHKITETRQKTQRKITKFSEQELKRNAPRLEKLAQDHEKAFNDLCRLIDELSEKTGKKTFDAPAGRFGIRAVASAVLLSEGWTEEKIIEYLEEHELKDFVRVEKELKRGELKSKQPKVPGIIYAGAQGEEEYFASVKPRDSEKGKTTRKERNPS